MTNDVVSRLNAEIADQKSRHGEEDSDERVYLAMAAVEEIERLRGEAEVADEQLAQLRGFAEAHKNCRGSDEPKPDAALAHYGWGVVNANGPNGIINWGRSPRSEVWRALPGETMVELFYHPTSQTNEPHCASCQCSELEKAGFTERTSDNANG